MFPEPIGIFYIIIGDPLDLIMDQLLGDILDFFGRDPRIDAARFADHIFQHHGPGSNNRMAVHNGIVHDDRTHTDQYIVMQGAAMYNGMMSDRDFVPNGGAIALVSTVDAGPVLHIDLVPDIDEIHVSAYDGIEPKTAVIPAYHIAHDGGIGRDETIIPEPGNFILNRQNEWHSDAKFSQFV